MSEGKIYKKRKEYSCFCIPSTKDEDVTNDYIGKAEIKFEDLKEEERAGYMKKEDMKVANAVDRDEYVKIGEAKIGDLENKENYVKKEDITFDGMPYQQLFNLLNKDELKREIVKKIINKTNIYHNYNTPLKEVQTMPDDIDIIYDQKNNQWITKDELISKKIKEFNKCIKEKQSSTDLACFEKNKAPFLLHGKNYNLKNAFEKKYKKVLVIGEQ